jgi:RHS repeat-associated protein
VYGDDPIGSYNLLGEYGNGGTKSAGRLEYIYLPTETGTAQLIGLYKNNRFYAVHTDHLGTPRSITDDTNKVVWQWAYSAFGDNKPTGILKATTNSKAAITNSPKLLTATSPSFAVNLRFPGQYWDEESKLSYNYFRNYQPNQGRYTQADPIGLEGGWSRFGYVSANPLMFIDPDALRKTVNLGEGYTGGIDTFDVSGSSSFEIHVYDASGKEIGIYGPNGWFDKHGLRGAPDGLPSSVEAQCKGQAVDIGRRMGKIPAKGTANISGSKWKKFFGRLPLLGPLVEMTRPSPERACDINPFAEYCQQQ